MNHNPYAPPSADVADVGQQMVRPLSVTIAAVLLFSGLAFDLWYWVANFSAFNRGDVSDFKYLGRLVGLAIAAWLYLKVYAGRNWARIVLLVFVVGAIALSAFFVRTRFSHLPLGALLPLLMRPVINAIALVLVFGPGRAWFAAR